MYKSLPIRNLLNKGDDLIPKPNASYNTPTPFWVGIVTMNSFKDH